MTLSNELKEIIETDSAVYALSIDSDRTTATAFADGAEYALINKAVYEAAGLVKKEDLIWKMIEDWQDARDSSDDSYLTEPRFSFNDIEHDLYGYFDKPIPKRVVKKEGDEIFQNLPDLGHVDDAAKMAHINEMLAITCKPLIATFYMLGLKEHITGTIENNGDWFELSLKKLPAPPSQLKK